MKKIVLLIFLNLILSMGFVNAADTNISIKGLNQLEKKMSLNIINRLQATADNDGLTFASQWPDKYFYEGNINPAYLYVTENNDDYLKLVIFRINRNMEDKNCFGEDTTEFCIPNISPSIEKYSYKKRFIVEKNPDFAINKDYSEKLEVLVKDGEYFDTKYITKTKNNNQKTYRQCDIDSMGIIDKCQTFNKENDNLLYYEKLEKQPDLTKGKRVYKYTKYSPEGNKQEEYFYSSGKHIFYNPNGDIQRFVQWNEDKFKFYDENLPELYVETIFVRDDNNRVIKEQIYDRNHRIVRAYNAAYKDNNNEIEKITVNDYINSAEWDILPIGLNDIVNIPFKIRM